MKSKKLNPDPSKEKMAKHPNLLSLNGTAQQRKITHCEHMHKTKFHCMVPLYRPSLDRYMQYFKFSSLSSKYLVGVQRPKPLNTKKLSYLIILTDVQAAPVLLNRSPKNAGTIQILFGLRFEVSKTGSCRRTACAPLWRIFSSNKSAPANRKKGLSRLPKHEKNSTKEL
jgi:hypothetical protein